MKWRVEVRGEEKGLEDLFPHLSLTGLAVVTEGEKYYLVSGDFDELNEAAAVRACAMGLVRIMNGAARLIWDDFQPLEVSVVQRIRQDGRHDQFIFPAGIPATSRVGVPRVFTPQEASRVEDDATPAEALLAAAHSDKAVEKALRIYGNRQHNWVNLYNILEVIASDVGDLAAAGFATKAEVKLFKRTASSAWAVGDDARHGHEKYEPPKRPMSLARAQSLVRTVLERWLALKR